MLLHALRWTHVSRSTGERAVWPHSATLPFTLSNPLHVSPICEIVPAWKLQCTHLPNEWAIARFAAADVRVEEPARVAAARAALACGDLAELRRAVEDRLTSRRFLENMRLAWRLTRLRIPADPPAAQRELCWQG